VTVPGTVSGWAALLERCGTLSLAECLAPAIQAAEEGFAVSERISAGWQRSAEKLARDEAAAQTYLPAPRPGEIHRQPDLAHTLRLVAEGGADAFYQGPLARQIAAAVQAKGGYLAAEDLAAHRATWDAPIRTAYRGVEILEHPPNGQGLAALLALNVVEGYDLAGMDYYDPARWHLLVEAMRLGMVDAGRYVADFRIEKYGSFLLKAVHKRSGKQVAETEGSVSLPYPLEYLKTTPDPAPLQHAALVTGGHDDVAVASVWNPDKESISYVEDLWPWVLLVVAGLMLLDVYAKRVRIFGYRTIRFD